MVQIGETMTQEMITVAARILLDHYRQIRDIADQRGVKMSDIFREAVAEYVTNNKGKP